MNAFKFRVLLDTENDEIFRDIVVQKNASMEVFFREIMKAFSFEGNQMASFYKSNDDWDKGFEITLLDMGVDEDADEPVAIMTEHEVREFITEPDQKLILVYDFFRMWVFLIELLGTVNSDALTDTTLTMGEAPAEDSKMMNEDYVFESDSVNDEDDDSFDFDENDDYDSFDEYDNFGDFEEYDL